MASTNSTVKGHNLYVYCFNNPVMYTDSEGEWPSIANIISGIINNASKILEEVAKTTESYVEEVKTCVDNLYSKSVDVYTAANSFDEDNVSFNDNKFMYQNNEDYNLLNADDYAEYLKDNYYQNSNRTTEGLYVELQAHYIFYLIGNSHAVNGADMLEADWKYDKTAVISEIIGKFIFFMP